MADSVSVSQDRRQLLYLGTYIMLAPSNVKTQYIRLMHCRIADAASA